MRFLLLLGLLLPGLSLPIHASELLGLLHTQNDAIIDDVLIAPVEAPTIPVVHRINGTRLMLLACAYTQPASRHHRSPRLAAAMTELGAALEQAQYPSGLFDSGNLESPPDTAFILETLCQALTLLQQQPDPATAAARDHLGRLILAAAEGVRTGGVHTPNHRWHVAAALAHAARLYPAQRYIDRIDEWLAEGIDQDADGQFSERSPAYNSRVINPALLHLAHRLNRPDLLDPVRRNLEMTLAYVEPNGDVEAVASRRQDQLAGSRLQVWEFYAPYRFLAVRDANPRFAAAAQWIEREFADRLLSRPLDPNMPLPLMLELSELIEPLPEPASLQHDHATVFPGSGLARIRRGDVTATIYGGSDAKLGLGVGSGLATNPTFFKLRKGAAILESVRLTPDFFGTGFFYGEGLAVEDGRYRLQQELRVPYHQPLRPEHRNPDGNYALTSEGRFFAKMSFAQRPKDFRTLRSTITITEAEGGFALEFVIDGHPNVPVTIEFAFRGDGADGRLSGVETQTAPAKTATGRFVLREGMGRFIVHNDTIEFGPGSLVHPPGVMESESVRWVGGEIRTEGQRVYLTGITPFRHTVTVR